MSNLDYQIAKDYLLKLPEKNREELCTYMLNNLQKQKKSKKEIEKDYSEFLKSSKSFQDFKRKYGLIKK